MKITLEVLKEKGASECDIQCFERLRWYYGGETEFEHVDFLRTSFDEETLENFDHALFYGSIDTLQELRDVVDFCINHCGRKTELYRTFKFCHAIYKQDVELCKKAIHFYLDRIHCYWKRKDILNNCGEFLALLPDLHEKLKNYVDSWGALKNTMLQLENS